MPTGYTAGVQDGSIATFREFAMQCARAFGACIMMRDDPMDKAIPETFEPDTRYHDEALARARATLDEMAQLTLAECEERARVEHQENVTSWYARRDKREEQRRRYQQMLEQVDAWTPPTPDHVEMRSFMQQQLRKSIDFDCRDSYDTEPVRATGADWRAARIKNAERDIAYHEKSRAEEIDRARQRTAWVNALRESLPEGA